MKSAGIGAVVLDSSSEIEMVIRGTTEWADKCKTDKGKHSGFKEPTATVEMFREVIVLLKNLQRSLDVHVAMSCLLNVTELGQFNEIVEGTPRLQGYSVAESIVPQFPDIVVVGEMTKNNKSKHKIQFMSNIKKQSVDEIGNLKKCMNFKPRLLTLGAKDLPEYADAHSQYKMLMN
jgi:hypothetical protein